MKKINFITLFSFLLFASFAHALLPTSKTILARTTHGHGKGAYILEQDLTFKTEGDPIVLREKWTIVNPEVMRLSVSRKGSDDIRFDVIYRGSKKTEASKSQAVSQEFAEPCFFYRTAGSLQAALVRAKVLPPDFGQKPRQIVPANSNDKSENAALVSINEPYVRLSRTSGVVAYELGRIAEPKNPGAWIEQDAFNLTRIQFPSMDSIDADNYLSYANNLHFPKERTYKWGNNIVTARVVAIRQATDQEAAKNLSAPPDQASRVPEITGLKEFYSRFR